MAITKTEYSYSSRKIEQYTQTSTANAAQTCTSSVSTPSEIRKLLCVMVAYSGVPVQTGATVTLNSAVGAAYDTLLNAGSANVQYTFFTPDGDVIAMPGDTFDVLAPAGGGSLTSSVTIIVERLDH